MYDVIVIGGGPGGYAAAIRAAQLGAKVALVESNQIGGTCVNRGCIPSKIWHRAAELNQQIKTADIFGLNASISGMNVKALCERKDGVAADIRLGMEGILGSNKVEYIKGRALVKRPGIIDVDGKNYQTKKTILATGSRFAVPDIPGIDSTAMTTSQFFETGTLPESILVIGGGPIEAEMASLLVHLGCRVVLATEKARTLPNEDRDTSQRVTQALHAAGVKIIRRCVFDSVEKAGTTAICHLSKPKAQKIETEAVLIGMRKPNTDGMGLEAAGIKIDDNGSVQVDRHLQTSVNGIYAIGDATGGTMLSHAATAMGITAAENAMNKTAVFKPERIPRGIWTSPEVGSVGLSEEEAEAQGYDIQIGDFPYAINGLAMAEDRLAGAVKIVSDARYGEILGVHVVGPRATEIIGEAVLAMELEATVASLAKSIRVHPTFSETMVDAARHAAKWALYLPAD